MIGKSHYNTASPTNPTILLPAHCRIGAWNEISVADYAGFLFVFKARQWAHSQVM